MRARLEFLAQFLTGRRPNSFPEPLWRPALRASPSTVCAEFLEKGLLVEASLHEQIASEFTVADLRAQLKARALKVSGCKADLIERLMRHDPQGAQTMASRAGARPVYVCSQQGRAMAEKFVATKKAERAAAEGAAFAALRLCDFPAAVAVVAEYQAKQILPAGLNVDWSSETFRAELVEEVKGIFETAPGRPRILSAMEPAEFRRLQTAAAVMLLWGNPRAPKLTPPGFVSPNGLDASAAARMILFFVRHRTTLAQMNAFGVRRVQIMASDRCCNACAKLTSIAYSIDAAPELPHEFCADPRGCRCLYAHDPQDFPRAENAPIGLLPIEFVVTTEPGGHIRISKKGTCKPAPDREPSDDA